MELWTALPWWIRYSIGFAFMAAATAILFFADRVPLKLVGLLYGIGFVCLIVGPSAAEKKGYRF